MLHMEPVADSGNRLLHAEDLGSILKQDPSCLQGNIHHFLYIYLGIQALLQIHHVRKKDAVFIDWLSVIIRKKISQNMGIGESALFIESNRLRAVPRTYIHGIASVAVMLADKMDHILSIAFSLVAFPGRNIFQLAFPVFQQFYDTDCPDLALIYQNEHLSFTKIFLNHILLRVRQQQHIHIVFFAFGYQLNIHSLLPVKI